VLLPLPAARFEACAKTAVRVSSISLVRYRANDYSAPTEFGQALFELPDHVAGVGIPDDAEAPPPRNQMRLLVRIAKRRTKSSAAVSDVLCGDVNGVLSRRCYPGREKHRLQ
jgi:hypothetical protein